MRFLLASFLICFSAAAQNAPRVSMDRFMNLRFYPNDGGGFMVDKLHIVFPPEKPTKGRVILTKGGKTVSSVPVVSEVFPERNLSAFGQVVPDRVPGQFKADGAGDYTLTLELGGRNIGAYSFRLEQPGGSDPFAPKAGLRRVGPWSKAAIVSNTPDRPDDFLRVRAWLSTVDLPGYQPKRQTPFTGVLLRGGKEIAYAPDMVASDEDWNYFTMEMYQGVTASKKRFTWADLVKTPGDYSFGIRVKGAIAKEYRFKVEGGTIVRIPQNQLSYQGADSLSPQGVPQNNREEQFWTAAVQ
jgi:hypothetical protein